jgi:hypothetical protein
VSGNLLHTQATIICPHGGRASPIPAQSRVTVGGDPVDALSDQYTVTGCPFTLPNGKPQPCVTVRWVTPSARVTVGGAQALDQGSVGICQSAEQIPQGPPTVSVVQQRVRGL